MMYKLIQVRITRSGKLTLLLAAFILAITVLVFNLFARGTEYLLYMVNLDSLKIANIAVWILRYGIGLFVLFFCVGCLLVGEWDLNYKLVVRCRLKDEEHKKYKFKEIINESLYSIEIFRNNVYESIEFDELQDINKLEQEKCLFCRINKKYYAVLKDLIIDEGASLAELDSLEITVYDYVDKGLLYNKGLEAYKFRLYTRNNQNNWDMSDEGRELNPEYTLYFKNCMETNEIDLKDSFMDDFKDGINFIKKFGIAFGIVVLILLGVRFYRLNIIKKELERNGVTITSDVGNVNVLFDSEDDVYLMPLINSNLVQISPWILEEFNRQGWKIRITNENMKKFGIYFGLRVDAEIYGATSFPYKYIIIPNNADSIDASVIHEMGHFLDHWKYTMSEEWAEIYRAENHKYIRDYARLNQFEGFACVYMEYVIVNESLKNRAPFTYEFIDRIVNEKKEENSY